MVILYPYHHSITWFPSGNIMVYWFFINSAAFGWSIWLACLSLGGGRPSRVSDNLPEFSLKMRLFVVHVCRNPVGQGQNMAGNVEDGEFSLPNSVSWEYYNIRTLFHNDYYKIILVSGWAFVDSDEQPTVYHEWGSASALYQLRQPWLPSLWQCARGTTIFLN